MPPTSNTETRTRRDNSCRRNLALVVVTIFVIFMAIISIAWLVMHPRDPGFRVTSLSVTNFAVSDSQVRGRYEVVLTVTNPNGIQTEVVLPPVARLGLYGQEWPSVAQVQPQPQPQPQSVFMEKLTNKSVKVDLELVRDRHHKVVSPVLVEYWNKGVINFNVVFSVKVRFEAGIWPSKDKLLKVQCMDLDVGFLSPTKDTGKLLGIGKPCNT